MGAAGKARGIEAADTEVAGAEMEQEGDVVAEIQGKDVGGMKVPAFKLYCTTVGRDSTGDGSTEAARDIIGGEVAGSMDRHCVGGPGGEEDTGTTTGDITTEDARAVGTDEPRATVLMGGA